MKVKGFTLIELVVVIVILGILAATAAPKFINLEADAHTATLQAVKASMEGASALVYGKAIVKGSHNLPLTDNPSVDIGNGITLDISYGYPLNSTTDWRTKLIDVDPDRFKFTKTVDGAVVVYPAKITKPVSALQNCLVSYKAPSAGKKPLINVNSCQ